MGIETIDQFSKPKEKRAYVPPPAYPEDSYMMRFPSKNPSPVYRKTTAATIRDIVSAFQSLFQKKA